MLIPLFNFFTTIAFHTATFHPDRRRSLRLSSMLFLPDYEITKLSFLQIDDEYLDVCGVDDVDYLQLDNALKRKNSRKDNDASSLNNYEVGKESRVKKIAVYDYFKKPYA
jgi:hypothetical protein